MPPFKSAGGKEVARDYPMSDKERENAKGKTRAKILFAGKPKKNDKQDTKKSEARRNAIARRMKARNGNGGD